MATQNWTRAAEVDREETVEILRRAYVEGRLDSQELDERTDSALRAHTIGELRRLIVDLLPYGPVACLPSDRPGPSVVSRGPGPKAGGTARLGLLLLLAVLVLAAIGAATTNVAVMTLAVPAALIALGKAAGSKRAGPKL